MLETMEGQRKGRTFMSVVSMRKLLESGAHFGHQTRRWNPKMKSYIHTSRAGTHILDLNQTLTHLNKAYDKMKEIGANGGKVLFVGTKKQASTIVVEEALRSNSFFINQRWLGGLLTNFKTIQKSIGRMVEIEKMIETGSINVYTKKEQIQLQKEVLRLQTFLGGIKLMKVLPQAIFVVDPTEDTIAVMEAKKLGIPVFGFMDTNCDPELLDYGIPANDDAIRSIRLMVSLMADALLESVDGAVLTTAYTDDTDNDITMAEVVANVERQNEENERRRKARMEERRQRQENRKPYSRDGGYNKERRDYKPRERSETPASTTTEATPAVKATSEVKNND